MLKRELTDLLLQYSNRDINLIKRRRIEDSTELAAIKAIHDGPLLAQLTEDAALPVQALDALKQVLNSATSMGESTVSILDQLQAHLYPFDFSAPWKRINLEARLANQPHSIDITAFFKDGISAHLDYVTASRLARTCRAGKFVTLNPDSEIFKKSASRLLELVMKGEQIDAEAMIKTNPQLLDVASQATDDSGRAVLTKPLKYAVWGGDWYMYKMILKYLRPAIAIDQMNDLNFKGMGKNGEYGSRFDFNPLFAAYKIYLQRANAIWTENLAAATLAELNSLWVSVFQEQAKLPIHVIHQFFHPDRSFIGKGNTHPEFNEEALPRHLQKHYRCVFPQNGRRDFGVHFGLVRYNMPDRPAYIGTMLSAERVRMTVFMKADLEALSNLLRVIIKNHEQTFTELSSLSHEMTSTSSTSQRVR